VKWPVRIFASIAVAALTLVLLMTWSKVSPVDVLAAVWRVPPEAFLGALALHLFTYAMRAVRFRVLIPVASRPGFRQALVISSAHNMASYLLPAKTGEASLVVYLRLKAGVPAAIGLAALLVARFLDGATLCICLSSACFYLAGDPRYDALEWLGSAGIALVAAAFVFLVLSLRGDLIVRALRSPLIWIRLHRWNWGEHLLGKLNSLAAALRAGANGRLTWGFLVSFAIWASVFGFYAVLAGSMGMPEWIRYPEVTFGASLGLLFNLLPFNGAAGMGTQELGWVMGFNQFLGVDGDVALSTGMGVHLIQLFNIVVLGVIAHCCMSVMPRTVLDEE